MDIDIFSKISDTVIEVLSMAGVKTKKLNEFLENSESVYQIPIYQRKYTWDKNDCEKFLRDIYNWYKKILTEDMDIKNDNYFAGSVITYTDKDKISSIVDGQQRITTTILILCALKYHLNKDNNTKINNKLDIKDIDKLIFSESWEIGSKSQRKLKLNNPLYDDILSKISRLNIDIEQDNLLYKNFNHLIKVIDDIKKTNEN